MPNLENCKQNYQIFEINTVKILEPCIFNDIQYSASAYL